MVFIRQYKTGVKNGKHVALAKKKKNCFRIKYFLNQQKLTNERRTTWMNIKSKKTEENEKEEASDRENMKETEEIERMEWRKNASLTHLLQKFQW